MDIQIPYRPHQKQKEVHDSQVRFKIVAAGRRSGKTTLAINELIRQALTHPQTENGPVQRSWFVCGTYKQAEMVGWRTLMKYLPQELIKVKRGAPHLSIELLNGHVIEFKGCEDPDRLRGVALTYVVLDEYGLMAQEVWTEVIRPMLVDTGGGALFIGTPGPDGSPHFHDLHNQGKLDGLIYKSWLFHTLDNPNKQIQEDVEQARKELPPDIFKREFEADFDTTAGLIYDEFRNGVHVIPNYEPDPNHDFIVGSIDPGLQNPTGVLLTAWDERGAGRVFWEYYERDRFASENAMAIKAAVKPWKVAYWVIDRASQKRDMTNGMSVFGKYAEVLRPLLAAPNDPGSVWAGIDEVKKLFHVNPSTNRPRLYVSAMCRWTLWELGRYIRYKHKWRVDKNEEERPRKKDDHLMDCLRNMIYTKPWIRPTLRMYQPDRVAYPV